MKPVFYWMSGNITAIGFDRLASGEIVRGCLDLICAVLLVVFVPRVIKPERSDE